MYEMTLIISGLKRFFAVVLLLYLLSFLPVLGSLGLVRIFQFIKLLISDSFH